MKNLKKIKKKVFYIITCAIAIYVLAALGFTIKYFFRNKFPEFVYSNIDIKELGVPVFFYHTVEPERFERHLNFLKSNGYRTLTSDEFYEYLQYGRLSKKKSVLITFDDGRGSLWSVAYPLLKKYKMKATAFIIPGELRNGNAGSNLENSWKGDNDALIRSLERDSSEYPFITWEEARKMYKSGLIDFQSHSLKHTKIFISKEIIDFINPETKFSYNNDNIPVLRIEGKDVFHHHAELGTPIYLWGSRMGPKARYFDDENLRNFCIEYVKQRGGREFFNKDKRWKKTLYKIVDDYQKSNKLKESYETDNEQIKAILYSLEKSKEIIEKNIPDQQVKHLAYPWGRGAWVAQELSRKACYKTNFFGSGRGMSTVKYGDDQYNIVRIADKQHMKDIILSLPGKGRMTFTKRFLKKWGEIILKPTKLYVFYM